MLYRMVSLPSGVEIEAKRLWRAGFLVVLSTLAIAGSRAGTPANYYDTVTTASASALRTSLNSILTSGVVQLGYDNLFPIMYVTDEDPANTDNVLTFYGRDSRAKTLSSSGSNSTPYGGWNREHAYPQSFFNFAEPMRSDLHALFPEDVDTNTFRSNNPYGPVTATPTYTDVLGNKRGGNAALTGASNRVVWEPSMLDRGRAARAILFMDIRYEGNRNAEPDLVVNNTHPPGTGGNSMAYLSALLDWHRQYPPTAWERARNAKVYNRQKNANPFVDRPELAAVLFGGTAWSMTNGDTLSVSTTNRAPATVSAGTLDVPALSVSLDLAANEFHLSQMSVSQLGTATDSEISAVKLWWDVDGNGVATTADTLLDTRTFSAGAATFSLGSRPFYVAPGSGAYATKLLVTTSVSANTLTGKTIQVRLNGSSIVPSTSGGVDTPPTYTEQTATATSISGGLNSGDSITVSSTNRAPFSAIAGAADLPVLGLGLTLAANEWDLGQLNLQVLGTITDSELTGVNLFRDTNNNGRVDSGEALVASGTFSGGTSTLEVSPPVRITPGTSNFLLTLGVSSSAAQGKTITLRVAANGIISSSSGGNDVNPSNANLDSGQIVIYAPTSNTAPGLIISEVFEGTSGNLKYVELHNMTTQSINLAAPQLSLRRYANGSFTFTTINLTGTINPGGFLVVANNTTDFFNAFGFNPTMTSGNISHNGNDVYDLFNSSTSTILDTFAGDLAGTSTNFAIDVVAFRKLDELPNGGTWGSATVPGTDEDSPSGFWATRKVTASNANATAIGSPGGSGGAAGAEVPVTISGFAIE